MTSPRPGKPSLNLKSVRRRSVSVSKSELVKLSFFSEDQKLPRVIEPSSENLDPVAWARENVEMIERELLQYGAVLFRGFDTQDVETFERFALTQIPEFLHYIEGSSPRIMTDEGVYTSTEYPPEYFISMHNELSYAHRWPAKIFFYCLIEPQVGGETPIADSRLVLQRLSPEIRRKFSEKGVLYTRNLHGGQGAGLSWQTVFETDDREAVESYCREGEIEFEWTDKGGLRTRQTRPAIIRHPKTGEELWFNQVDQWHPSNLTEDVSTALLAMNDEKDLPINAYFGDESPLDASELDEVRRVFDETLVAFPWHKGDILLVDNMLAAHGRKPFEGPRKILVTMGSPVALTEVEHIGA